MAEIPLDIAIEIVAHLGTTREELQTMISIRSAASHFYRNPHLFATILKNSAVEKYYRNRSLNEETLEIAPNSLWKYIMIPFHLLEKYSDKFNWEEFSGIHVTDDDYLEKYQDKIKWSALSYCSLTEAQIKKYWNRLDPLRVTREKARVLSDAFIKEYGEYLDWDILIRHRKISSELLILYWQKIDPWLMDWQKNTQQT